MEISEQIKEHVARARLGQQPQAEFQMQENVGFASPSQLHYWIHGDPAIATNPPYPWNPDTPSMDIWGNVAEWCRLRDNKPRVLWLSTATSGLLHRRPRIVESHRGVVSEVLGDEVEITYEMPAGP